MKTNAPEKLYLHPAAYGKVGASWLTFPLTNEDIEYVRADSFIEKACDFISSLRRLDDDVIEDFRKYMEGE